MWYRTSSFLKIKSRNLLSNLENSRYHTQKETIKNCSPDWDLVYERDIKEHDYIDLNGIGVNSKVVSFSSLTAG